MTMPLFATRVMALMMVVGAATAGAAQTVTEWSTETRLALSFRVNEAAAQRLLPAGWTVAPSASPANRGANLTMSFIERQLVLDPQGKPLRTGTSRYMVLTIPARNAAGEANTIVVGGLSPEGAGAYGAYVTASVARVERTSSAQNEEAGQATEHWEFTAVTGERLDLRLSFRRATPVKGRAEAKLRSATRPDFTRTYRIDQATDVLRSAASPDRITELTFRASGPALAALFDGTEQLLSVTSLPWYVREVSVP